MAARCEKLECGLFSPCHYADSSTCGSAKSSSCSFGSEMMSSPFLLKETVCTCVCVFYIIALRAFSEWALHDVNMEHCNFMICLVEM